VASISLTGSRMLLICLNRNRWQPTWRPLS
jgi:hypothetical protein